MNAELIKNKVGIYEIWVDDKYVTRVDYKLSENSVTYKLRAEREFENYCENLKRLNKPAQAQIIKSVTI